jgi:hypothetical protein
MIKDLVKETRSRIAKVTNEPIRYGLMACYLLAARASEVVGVASASDTTTPYGPRGNHAWEDAFQAEGPAPERVAVFRVRTAKRQGLERFIALPLDPRYEPWSRPLLDYYRAQGGENLVFPFTRQTLFCYAREAFSGLTYEIEPQRIEGGRVERHSKDAGVHFLRHVRASELASAYGFSAFDLATYCGWTLKNAGLSSVMARYVGMSWQSYFPRLLVER